MKALDPDRWRETPRLVLVGDDPQGPPIIVDVTALDVAHFETWLRRHPNGTLAQYLESRGKRPRP